VKNAKFLVLLISVCAAALFCSCAASSSAPPPRQEAVLVSPHPQAVWAPGHWKWSFWRHRWVWISGHWKLRKGNRWVVITR
jgi:hypothetical protein